jgi:hypothetical protein
MLYIAELLRHPDKRIASEELSSLRRLGAAEVAQAASNREKAAADKDFHARGVSVQLGQASLADGLDEADVRQYKAEIRRRQAELDEAALGHRLLTPERKEMLLNEIEAIWDVLQQDTWRGKAKLTRNDKPRIAVTKSIKNALRVLEKQCPEAAEHLQSHITTGSSCIYRSDSNVTWQL